LPDLLTLEGAAWSVNVWSRDVAPAQRQLKATLAARGGGRQHQELRVNAAGIQPVQPMTCMETAGLTLEEAVFFENRSYEFEFTFAKGVRNATVTHGLNAVQDAFRETGDNTNEALRGTINFGNDIGWFRLCLTYQLEGRQEVDHIAFEVLPTKMDMASDLNGINLAIDETYPLWRFSFVQKTEQELSRSRKPHERFPLLWLAQFQSLRHELLKQVRIVCNAPHSRLQETDRKVRMDRLKGKLGTRLEERVHDALLQRDTDRMFRVKTRRLSVDTPENRFVLMVLRHSSRELAQFASRARMHNGKPDKGRVSEAFFSEIQKWRQELDQRMVHPMFADVGRFEGMERESLVLHQRAGYAGVYRVWQQLKQYLDVFGRHAAISVKSVAELYEVWCLLEIRSMLVELGFKENVSTIAKLQLRGLEKELEDGIGASFRFVRDDNLKVRLAHEPVFGEPQSAINRIYSWTAVQKPDIVLEVTFPNGELIRWIFDAKYRVDTGLQENASDLVPEDALNQMHRYRDALIHLGEKEDGQPRKTRPFIGAYVLYPGWFPGDQQDDPDSNPYAKAIDAVGIGAFPALPGQENGWLAAFLARHLARRPALAQYRREAPDSHLVQQSVRIAPTGLTLRREGDLLFVAPAGSARSQSYLDSFRAGTAGWYHTRDEAIHREHIPLRVMNDITHVAVAVPHTAGSLSVTHVYAVKSVKLCPRHEISEFQSGTANNSTAGNYWLFELGESVELEAPVQLTEEKHFRFAMCTLTDLKAAKGWFDISGRYSYLYDTATEQSKPSP
jgi:hypothetical protein